MSTKHWLSIMGVTLAIAGAGAIFALVLLYPWTVALSGPVLRKLLFPFMVVAATLGFAYGLGFRAKAGAMRFLLSPFTVFALISAALGWIAYALSVGPEQL